MIFFQPGVTGATSYLCRSPEGFRLLIPLQFGRYTELPLGHSRTFSVLNASHFLLTYLRFPQKGRCSKVKSCPSLKFTVFGS